MVLDISLGDIIRLKKKHPCGGSDWEVVRLGADIGIKCMTCGHRLLVGRALLEKRLEMFITRSGSRLADDS